jgi:release factor glutamine methyltransferase
LTPVHVALRNAAMRLEAQGIGSPRLDAELLLAEVRGHGRARLLAELREVLTSDEAERFDRFVERRMAREPLAYLLGSAWFHGLEFSVSPAVLIPRPETELLVDWALGWIAAQDRPLQIIDVGTGSGAIALSLAHALSSAGHKGSKRAGLAGPIYASDLSRDALWVAESNAERLGLRDRVRFLEADLLPASPLRFDLVLANLPYVGLDDRDRVMEDVDRYEPHLALYSGPDGLDHIRRLLLTLDGRLAPGGAIALEIGDRQGAALKVLLRDALPGARCAVHKDLAGLDRLATAEDPRIEGRPSGRQDKGSR